MLEDEVFGMYHQTHCRFYKDFAYDSNFAGAAKCFDEGDRLLNILGNKSVLFMGNHGVLLAAPNVALAFDNAYYLERACMHQVGALVREHKGNISRYWRGRGRGRGRGEREEGRVSQSPSTWGIANPQPKIPM